MLSAIICTYNRDKYLYNALKSIANQNYPVNEYEIVLINNNSTDNTEFICQKFQEDYSHISFKYHVEKNQGLSYARNRGVKQSTGDILIFIDDDATVFDDYLDSISNFFNNNPDILVCGGPIVPVYEEGKPDWISHFTNRLIGGALDEGKNIKPFSKGNYPGGGNSALRKEAFEKYGLYNPDLGRKGNSLIGAEEKDFYDRLTKDGKKIYYLPQMGIYHHIPSTKTTVEYFNKLTYSIGKSERIRTKSISSATYYKRVFSEGVKWIASFALFFIHTLTLHPQKGIKLLQFRLNVTKGLFGF